jgi:hypothetical protein
VLDSVQFPLAGFHRAISHMIAPMPARTDFLTQGAFRLGPNQRKLHKQRNPGPVESNARFLARTRERRLWTRNVTFVVPMVVAVTSRAPTHEGLKDATAWKALAHKGGKDTLSRRQPLLHLFGEESRHFLLYAPKSCDFPSRSLPIPSKRSTDQADWRSCVAMRMRSTIKQIQGPGAFAKFGTKGGTDGTAPNPSVRLRLGDMC